MPNATIGVINVSDLQEALVAGRQVNAGDYSGYALFAIMFAKSATGWEPMQVGPGGVLATSPIAWKNWITNQTPLGANGVFAGAGVNTTDFTMISGILGSNVAGTLYVDHCLNSAFAANTFTSDVMAYPSYWVDDAGAAVPLGTVVPFEVPRFADYVRLRYVNGGTAQIWFTLHAGQKTIVR